jgi:hypothetical protein
MFLATTLSDLGIFPHSHQSVWWMHASVRFNQPTPMAYTCTLFFFFFFFRLRKKNKQYNYRLQINI